MQNRALNVMLNKTVNGMEMKDAIWKLKRVVDQTLRIDSIHADIVAERFESMKGMAEAAARYRVLERGFAYVADLVWIYFDDLADDVEDNAETVEADFWIDLNLTVHNELENKLRTQMYSSDEEEMYFSDEEEEEINGRVNEGAEAVIQIAMSLIETEIERAKQRLIDECRNMAQE